MAFMVCRRKEMTNGNLRFKVKALPWPPCLSWRIPRWKFRAPVPRHRVKVMEGSRKWENPAGKPLELVKTRLSNVDFLSQTSDSLNSSYQNEALEPWSAEVLLRNAYLSFAIDH